jgi:hypothetical protein
MIFRILIFSVLLTLTSCKDRYRYTCQDPDNFGRAECQKPKCQFTQTCPEYLVAPILDPTNGTKTETPQATKSTVNR